MKKIILTLFLIFIATNAFASDTQNLSSDEALLKLKQGNKHFASSRLKHPDESHHRRDELVKGQHPFAAILSCSDSRVPTEIIFDQGLGDIFTIRNAGNVLDEHILGSIEYAVEHLGINLVVVMGHESCGAIEAAMSKHHDTKAIESLKKSIEPAICECKRTNTYTYENVIKTHAKLDVENILKDKDLCDYIAKHNVKIIPAYYHLNTGKVEFLN